MEDVVNVVVEQKNDLRSPPLKESDFSCVRGFPQTAPVQTPGWLLLRTLVNRQHDVDSGLLFSVLHSTLNPPMHVPSDVDSEISCKTT